MSCQHGEGFPQGTLVSLQQLPLDDFRLKAVVVGALMTLLTQRILVFSNICWMLMMMMMMLQPLTEQTQIRKSNKICGFEGCV